MRKLFIITGVTFILLSLYMQLSCDRGRLENEVQEYQLDNGMKWLLVKRGHAPVFAGVIQVKVGGVDEKRGKTGLAHMFEHMAFKGTTNIGTTDFASEKKIMEKVEELLSDAKQEEAKTLIEEQKKYIVPNEIWDIFSRNGALNLNAYTSKDVTEYHAEMPISKLELWMYLISEMVSDPAFREFYSERDVVLEEQRTSIDNNPVGRIYKTLLGKAFKNSPYAWPTIGFPEDVSSFTRQDLKEFYASRYLPECMVGSIVGDIDIKETKKWIKKYFGKIKGKNTVCHRTLAIDPPQEVGIDETVYYNSEPLVLMAFHKPTVPHFDDYIFDVMEYLLCEGESSRLIKKLVNEKKLAKRISCFNSYPGTRLDNLFVIYAEPHDLGSMQTLITEISGEIEKLKMEEIKPDELKKIKNQMKTGFLWGISTNFKLADMLVYFQNIAGDWRYIINHPKNVDQISLTDIVKTARRYFTPENTIVIKLQRKGG